ncbi:DUF3107 domain-containing protein [Tropheryma whipplei]|uniref:DUF3107 domain-containing protein n=1 Tax=Tropheryma whipplei TaxID=2039 RepID=UPI000000C7E0|nr:DUF3107 domain-containing protein [Tropheryma whipplei]MCO8182547.1 DUF3107 family protein [Tropheryma whipplei]MCO8189985.1 DUF3107 family protein [Tropheryma whipplei]CAD66917.1 conserved hypothetical protein [Tropheryma whipplei TW08/27]
MELKIGIANCIKEISFHVDITHEQLLQKVNDAVGNHGVLNLKDTGGEEIIIPGSALAYVWIVQEKKRVCGFVS